MDLILTANVCNKVIKKLLIKISPYSYCHKAIGKSVNYSVLIIEKPIRLIAQAHEESFLKLERITEVPRAYCCGFFIVFREFFTYSMKIMCL
jgi:hypothetical protein